MTDSAPTPDKPHFSSTGSRWVIPPHQRWIVLLGLALAASLGQVLAGFLIQSVIPWLPRPLSQGQDLISVFAGSVPHPLTSLVIGVITGLLLGGAQWLVLRRYLPITLRWMQYTVMGSAGMELARFGLSFLLYPYFFGGIPVLLGMFLALPLGIAQWLVLRPHIHKANRWILVYPVASFLVLFTPLLVSGAIHILQGLSDSTRFQLIEVILLLLRPAIFWGLVPAIALCFATRRIPAGGDPPEPSVPSGNS